MISKALSSPGLAEDREKSSSVIEPHEELFYTTDRNPTFFATNPNSFKIKCGTLWMKN